MKKIKLVTLIALFTFVVSCTTTHQAKVDFDRNENVQTAEYKTFAWLKDTKILAAPVDMNPVMKARIDDAIETAFINKGYSLVANAENADFTISYTLGNRDKIKVDSFPTTYRAGFGWGRGYYGNIGVGHETHVRSYSEGKLAIDVFDVKTKAPVWHGWAVKRISSKNKENPGRSIQPVVEQVVSQFN
ncbi:DUF4136 domain-containing protein [Thalassotalea atypica]|uniref:DUF4136 domain-containing protein n=1 Tax=Thalassotalea atypica TaxID=2054316 RepID=UPI002572EBF4|nr:DUF4136 domain-containing protein [Thalassotalea atypica]